MTVSENHRLAGEVFGTICWLWIFHRARYDLPVVLGWRHPWEHAPGDDHGHEGDVHHKVIAVGSPEMKAAWDKFDAKSTNYRDDDDDEDDDDE